MTIILLAAVGSAGGCATLSANIPVAQLSQPLKSALTAGEIGQGLDERAITMAANTEYRALEAGKTGATVVWRESGKVYGSVTPQQPYAVGATNCRRYTQMVSVNGKVTTGMATACRSNDGVWAPLS